MITPTANISQQAKGVLFRELHETGRSFLLGNPWDGGSARLLEKEGFVAVGSTSAGIAFSHGKPDGTISRRVALMHLMEICDSTQLPVTADLEDGYGASPADVAEAIRLSADAGAVGASIEDQRRSPGGDLYATEEAAERIRAAKEAALSLPFPFVLTARTEILQADGNIDQAIVRLQAYQEAGADVLFAPGVRRLSDVKALLDAVERPLSVMVGFPGAPHPYELFEIGVTRVSVGGSLARAALGELVRAARELQKSATAEYAARAIPNRELHDTFSGWGRQPD